MCAGKGLSEFLVSTLLAAPACTLQHFAYVTTGDKLHSKWNTTCQYIYRIQRLHCPWTLAYSSLDWIVCVHLSLSLVWGSNFCFRADWNVWKWRWTWRKNLFLYLGHLGCVRTSRVESSPIQSSQTHKDAAVTLWFTYEG